MEHGRLSALMLRGRSTMTELRSSLARTAATRSQSTQICQELQAIVKASQEYRASSLSSAKHQSAPEQSPEPAWLQDVRYYRLAETAIDQHGRWARHVVLQRAIDRIIAGDPVGEQVWRRVFNAILAMQDRPRQILPSTA
jgi:hypothetical protein